MLMPTWLLIVALLVLPACYVFWLSLHQSSFGQSATYVGAANYAAVLSDRYFWRALLNTLIVVAVVVHVEMLIGLMIALLFADGVPWKPVLMAVMLAPYAVSEVGAVVIWRYLVDPEIGSLTKLLAAFGLGPIEWGVNPWHGLGVIALISIWLHLPFTFVILYAARLALPGEVYEAARVDGATPWQQLRRITLPLLKPAIAVAMLFRYIFAFRLFSEVWLMTQGGPARSTEVVALYLYVEAFRYNRFGVATATGWIMVLVSALVALVYLRRVYREMFSPRSEETG
ncbi:MAG: sugar ABC transporter permease [Lautropia sp.]|nr:sugar ABC transporter permease [Lautropia sp.]